MPTRFEFEFGDRRTVRLSGSLPHSYAAIEFAFDKRQPL